MSEGCGGSFANGRLGQGSSQNRSIAPPQPQATSFISGRCVPARTCAGIGLLRLNHPGHWAKSRLFRRVQGPQGPDDPALRTGPVQAYIQTEIARSNTPTKEYDVITICSDRRSEGQLSTAATTVSVAVDDGSMTSGAVAGSLDALVGRRSLGPDE
eukprot:scaffold9336_cov133-Isochrysis_galbana.AAC.13